MAHVDEWAGFTHAWNPIIKPFVEKYGKRFPSFHMAPWINSVYPYSKFSEEEFGRLMTVINNHVRLHVVWSIEIDAYFEIIKARRLGETDIVRAFHICARKCMESVSVFAKAAGHKNRILHIFHHGNAAWPSFENSFNEEMLDSLNILRPISQSEIQIVPLQAADIIAHQMERELLVKQGMVSQPRKLYVDNLINVVPGMRKYIDTAELARLYAEEMTLEEYRKRGKFPAHTLRLGPDPVAMQMKMAELFKRPGDYQLREILKGGRQ